MQFQSYIVLNKLGEPVKDDTAVLCSIFSVDDDAFEFQQTETTVSGFVSGCGIGNAGVAESFIASASAVGVSSDPLEAISDTYGDIIRMITTMIQH